MKGTFHGITSILLIFISFILGLFTIYQHSILLASIYGASILVGGYIVLYVYCAKCPCKDKSCAHVFPGLMTRFLPDRKPGKYNKSEIAVVIIIVLFWVISPQYWLYQNGDLMLVFWLLLITGFYQINKFVCKDCDNVFCMANKKSMK